MVASVTQPLRKDGDDGNPGNPLRVQGDKEGAVEAFEVGDSASASSWPLPAFLSRSTEGGLGRSWREGRLPEGFPRLCGVFDPCTRLFFGSCTLRTGVKLAGKAAAVSSVLIAILLLGGIEWSRRKCLPFFASWTWQHSAGVLVLFGLLCEASCFFSGRHLGVESSESCSSPETGKDGLVSVCSLRLLESLISLRPPKKQGAALRLHGETELVLFSRGELRAPRGLQGRTSSAARESNAPLFSPAARNVFRE